MSETKEQKSPLEIAKKFGLSTEEFNTICTLLKRVPNVNEISIFSAMWSEHCSYKSSKKWLKILPSEGEVVVHGPGENAGVIDIGDNKVAIFKIESHNHPSFIEPYQGAATGVGGILRDVFTMGARPVALLNALRFGSTTHSKTKYLLDGVVSGIGGYGNCIGIPTIGGETNFDESYNGNILVNAMAIGIASKDQVFLSAAKDIGYPLVYVGAKTGRDGIHGASMASAEFDENTDEKKPTVQVGDPFTGKLLMEACLELMKTDSVVSIQDMGAAGLTSSSIEMASKGNLGIKLQMADIPIREEKMSTSEIMLSESQERMLMVIKPEKTEQAKSIFKKWDLDFAVIGEITDTKNIEIFNREKLDAQIPITFLVNDAPQYNREWIEPKKREVLKKDFISSNNISKTVLNLMNTSDLCSKSWIWEQYDTSVMGDTIFPPGQNAGMVRIHNTDKKLCASVDCTPRYVVSDPYEGSIQAVCEAFRNLIAVGSKPLAITNNLNFGNPEKREIMGQIVASIKGIKEASLKLNMPVVSGNVSLYNETNGNAILPTPVIGAVGIIDKNENTASMYDANIGDGIYIIGQNENQEKGWIGQSLYSKHILKISELYSPPPVDLEFELRNGNFITKAIGQNITNCVNDVSDGGLAISLAEILLNSKIPNIGAIIDKSFIKKCESFWFGEDQGRYLICSSKHHELINLAKSERIRVSKIGSINSSSRLTFSKDDYICINELFNLSKNWLKEFMA